MFLYESEQPLNSESDDDPVPDDGSPIRLSAFERESGKSLKPAAMKTRKLAGLEQLESYLSNELKPCGKLGCTDILAWWKVHSYVFQGVLY